MAVTVAHVASYAGSFEPDGWRWVGWFYALAVDASIAVCAWLTRWKTTRVMAWVGFFAFTVASGALNIAQVRPWDFELFTWIYALFPTAAIALLGFLARDAEELATISEASRKGREKAKAKRVAELAASQVQPALTDAQITEYKLLLLNRNGTSAKEKVWALNHLGIFDTQRDIAIALDISPSYVSAMLKEQPSELSESLLNLCAEVDSIGKEVAV